MGPRSHESIAPPKYEDFFLHLAAGRDGYAVHARSSRGEGTEPFVLPQVDAKEPPETTGERLFEALFSGRVLRLYEQTLARLDPGSGLRMKLMIDPLDPALGPLQALPWELMRQPGSPEFLALNRLRSIVRHLQIPSPVTACPRPERLRILVVAACPRGRDELDLEGEIRKVREALASAVDIEVVEPIPSTREEMRQALLARECHVLHFIGHGGFPAGEGILAFEADDGAEDPVSGTDLINKLTGFPTLRLVVLNACRSAQAVGSGDFRPFAGVAGALVLGGLPAVVAMRSPIYDDSAASFSSAFYRRLASGDPVDAAVVEGRQAAGAEWGIPVLFMRTPEGELFPEKDIVFEEPIWKRAAGWLVAAMLAVLLVGGAWRWRVESLMDQGREHFEEGRFDEARKVFMAALDLAPTSATIHSAVAAAAQNAGDLETAGLHYLEAQRRRPDDARHLYNLGSFLNGREDFDGAYPFLKQAVERDPGRIDAYVEWARAALHEGMVDEARAILQLGLRVPGDPGRAAPLHRLLGELELGQGSARDAISHFETALELYPDGTLGRIETASLLVQSHDQTGDTTAACREVWRFRLLAHSESSPWAPAVQRVATRRGCPSRF